MKRVIIARHAKSDWSEAGLDDIDRPLKFRGVSDAYNMAGRLKKRKIHPDLILSSPATRAIHTALIHARELLCDPDVLRITNTLYHSGPGDIIEMIRKLDEQYHSIMLFGHNPGFTDLANHFLAVPLDNIPTAGIVILDFQAATWQEVQRGALVADAFDYPKNE